MNSNQKNQTNEKFTRVGNFDKKTGQVIWKKDHKEEYSDFELGASWAYIDRGLEEGRNFKFGINGDTGDIIWASESKTGSSIRFYLNNVCHTISIKGFYQAIDGYKGRFVGVYRINPNPTPAPPKPTGRLIVNPQLKNPPPNTPIPLFVEDTGKGSIIPDEVIAIELPKEEQNSQADRLRKRLAEMSDEEIENLFKRGPLD